MQSAYCRISAARSAAGAEPVLAGALPTEITPGPPDDREQLAVPATEASTNPVNSTVRHLVSTVSPFRCSVWITAGGE
jgi:hypothetical protein